MKKTNEKLVNELTAAFLKLKKVGHRGLEFSDDLTHNEGMLLFFISGMLEENKTKVSLSELREKINFKPSTVTPIITTLEEKKVITRNIDKNDRRNIYIKLTSKGNEYIDKIKQRMKNQLSDYIDYMGEENIRLIIDLISKSSMYFKERKEVK